MNTKTQNPLSKRLLDGAAMLGRLWKRNQRCARAWNIEPGEYLENPFVLDSCGCEPETDFCKARRLWLTLAAQNGSPLRMVAAQFRYRDGMRRPAPLGGMR